MTDARKLPACLIVLSTAIFTCGCGGPEPATPGAASPTGDAPVAADGGGEAPVTAASLQIPDQPLAGKIHGQAFEPTEFELSGGQLEFSSGEGFFPDREFRVMLNSSDGLDGQTFVVTDPDQFIKPHVQVRWKVDGSDIGENAFIEKYVMKVELGQRKNRRLPGGIYFRSLDEGNDTQVAGRFVLELGPDFTKPPIAEDAPYVFGHVDLQGADEFKLTAGIVGGPADGKIHSNSAGSTFSPGGSGGVTSLTFEPQITSLNNSKSGLNYRHLVLQPGTYFVYIRWDDRYVDGRWLEVPEDVRLTADLTVDAALRGNLEVEVPDADENTTVMLTPLGQQQELPAAAARFGLGARLKLMQQPEGGRAAFTGLKAGRYHVAAGPRTAVAEVTAGETTAVELAPE